MQTPLTAWHQKHSAKMMEFGGYAMPIAYQGIIPEHHRVRDQAGMFDVSHMGEVTIDGPDACRLVDRLLTNRPSRLKVGQAAYTLMCADDGGTIDDLLTYRTGADAFLLVVNAANRHSDLLWIRAKAGGCALTIRDVSDETALIAVQGPKSLDRLMPLANADLSPLKPFHFHSDVAIAGARGLISRTGYTGEDGFELYIPATQALGVWESLITLGVSPIGLGARDTLRLEAGLCLYGHELSPTISPLEAGLKPFIRFGGSAEFIGQRALAAQASPQRTIVGLELDDGPSARAGFDVGCGLESVGRVTSGSFSPTLRHPIAMALIAREYSAVGTALWVAVRDRKVPARVVPLPFYRRQRA